MYCNTCGASNADVAVFCEKCGRGFQKSEPFAQAAAASGGGSSTQGCAIPRGGGRDDRVREPGNPMRISGRNYAVDKNPGIAVFMSLIIPGTGQLYNGDAKRGVIMLIGLFVSGFLMGAFGIGFLTWFFICVWAVFNAYNVAAGKTPLAK